MQGGSSPSRARGAAPSSQARTRKAEAIAAASKPRIVCNIKGARMASSIAGWAQANMSARAPIGDPVPRVGGLLQFGVDQLERFRRLIGSAPPARSVDEAPPRHLRRATLLRVRGRPLGSARRQAQEAKASASASSAPGTSRDAAARIGNKLAVALARHSGRDPCAERQRRGPPWGSRPAGSGRGGTRSFVFGCVMSIVRARSGYRRSSALRPSRRQGATCRAAR